MVLPHYFEEVLEIPGIITMSYPLEFLIPPHKSRTLYDGQAQCLGQDYELKNGLFF